MARFRFRRDTAVWTPNDTEISLMILAEHSWGVEYLGRKANPKGGYLYATASYHDTGDRNQFVSGDTFANGFTGGAFEYVARWATQVPASARA